MTADRIERLYVVVVEQLTDVVEPEAIDDLRVRVASGAPMEWCPPGVDEALWSELRRTMADNESLHPDSPMRRRLASTLTDLDLMRRCSNGQ